MRSPLAIRRARREARFEALSAVRDARRLLDEDVTAFGEALAGLHLETLTDVLSASARADYERALAAYEEAKPALDRAESTPDIRRVEEILTEGRFRLACVVARRDGTDLPQRRDPCFFDPRHGPASRDLAWAPPAGVVRQIPVCFGCAQRLEAGEEPEQRLVRSGDRWVPWYAAGGSSTDPGSIQAHVIRGAAWRSRTHEAEAMTQVARNLGGGAF